MKVELSDGGWAQLRDPKTLTNGERKPMMEAISEGQGVMAVTEASLVVMVESWSLPLPLPSVDAGSLDLMLAEDYDRLAHGAGELLPKVIWTPPVTTNSKKKSVTR